MKNFQISAAWGSRPEQPEEVAQRLRCLLNYLRPITPSYEHWYQVINEDNVPELDDNENWLDSVVAAKSALAT